MISRDHRENRTVEVEAKVEHISVYGTSVRPNSRYKVSLSEAVDLSHRGVVRVVNEAEVPK